MRALFHPTYLPSISIFSAMLQANEIWFEAFDNFQKQTYRNRAYIYGANGKLQLNIPVNHSQKNRQYYKDVTIAYNEEWQLNHQRSIESAYRTSPFFEFYQDEILTIYSKREKYLYDFNLKTSEVIFGALDIEFNYKLTENFISKDISLKDYRFLVNAKANNRFKLDSYMQVFESKYGFISDLSILDLLCNEGPNSVEYLNNQKLVAI